MDYLNANQRLANLLALIHRRRLLGWNTAGYFVNPSDRQHAIELLKRMGKCEAMKHRCENEMGQCLGLSLLI